MFTLVMVKKQLLKPLTITYFFLLTTHPKKEANKIGFVNKLYKPD
jgi:hypothetical protein